MSRSIHLSAILLIGAACVWNDNESLTKPVDGKSVEQIRAEGAVAEPWSEQLLLHLRQGCPMAVDGAKVKLSDTDGGVSLIFTRETGDLDDLRQRVQKMADRYQAHDGRRGLMWRHMRRGAYHREGKNRQTGRARWHGPMPERTAAVVGVHQGVQLTLTPKVSSELKPLREHVRAHHIRRDTGESWMATPQESDSPDTRWMDTLLK